MSQALDEEVVWIGPRKVPVWPHGTKLIRYPDGVSLVPNPDLEELHGRLIGKILEQEAVERVRAPQTSRAEGGQKIRELDRLGSPEFELINARAMALLKQATGAKTAVVDDCWANVFRDGEYALPHSHKRSAASIVYALDPGDEEEAKREPLNGVLLFSDPRLRLCCPGKANYVSGLFRPTGIAAAVMVIFPSIITHQVTPYYGKRPRISIAWNLNAKAVPGELRHDGKMS